jgi:hypothetical protein
MRFGADRTLTGHARRGLRSFILDLEHHERRIAPKKATSGLRGAKNSASSSAVALSFGSILYSTIIMIGP